MRKSFNLLVAATVGLYAIFTPAALLACPCTEIKPPENVAKEADTRKGLEYSYTEEFKKEFAQKIAEARSDCEKHIGKPDIAIVSDLDETLLDNRQEVMDHPDEAKEYFDKWISEGRSPLLEPTAEFLSWARRNGFAIFFISGRGEAMRRITIENLLKHQIAYDGLYLRQPGDTASNSAMKTNYRKQIEDMGFKIVLSIGDQYSDLIGGNAENCVKLPNKMYYAP